MSNFYTNVCMLKGKILVRAIDNGKRVSYQVPYHPYLFIKAKGKKTDFKTIHGGSVDKLDFENHWEMTQFVNRYKDVEDFEYYGMTQPIYTFINDNTPDLIKYNPDEIRVTSLDIEVDSKNGFPNLNPNGQGYGINHATKEITVIGLRSRGKNLVLGTKPYVTTDTNTTYMQCDDELDMLKQFLVVWNDKEFWQPDIVTGWNCIPLSQSVWGKNKIFKLSDLKDDQLYDSKLIKKFPITVKERWDIELWNGKKISSSGDHKFPVRIMSPDKYTNFHHNKKSLFIEADLKTREIESINDNVDIYLQIQLRKNVNVDNCKYSVKQLYLAGLIYTDGTLRNKNKICDGYRFYQSDIDLMNKLNDFGVDTKICGPYKNCYHRSIKKSLLGNAHELIYERTKKHLNLYELSTLSYKQFMYFLSGLLDGDGCNGDDCRLSWCNYIGDIPILAELCYWNGIFCAERKNTLHFLDYHFNDLKVLKKKRWKNFKQRTLKRKAKQKSKNIVYKKDEFGYWVKIKSVKYNGTSTRMGDLETDTHYFNTCGVKSHNCSGFDIPYLVLRIEKILGEKYAKLLSPWRHYTSREFQAGFGHTQIEYELYGLSVLDYMALYKKFSYTPQESYKLDTVAQSELKEGKRSYSKYGSMQKFYENDYQGFIDYNIQDNVLVDKLEEKKGFIKLVMAMAYDAKVNFKDCFSPTRVWDVIIHNFLFKQGIVVPRMKDVGGGSIEGAYVKEPIKGLHKWVVSFDLNSLYPHLIQMYNISPETFVGSTDRRLSVEDVLDGEFNNPIYKKYYDKGYTIATPGHIFDKKTVGFLPTIMKKMYDDRVVWKKRMIEEKKEIQLIEEEMKKRGINISC
jgi:hypothetical protein